MKLRIEWETEMGLQPPANVWLGENGQWHISGVIYDGDNPDVPGTSFDIEGDRLEGLLRRFMREMG